MTLGEILKGLISEKNMTQKQLANCLNISASTLGNYIQCVREPDFEMLRSIADFFGVSIDYLLDHRTNHTLSHVEDDLLRIFRLLTEDQREIFIEQGKLFVAQNIKKRKSSDSRISKNRIG
ncbi:MAG: helix-turn-helix domain-containing protein [Oscillospiraceae bacterium]|nr:helix-turn-helix domain-containing protein [Oscillospiraceae bacterium]